MKLRSSVWTDDKLYNENVHNQEVPIYAMVKHLNIYDLI